MDKIEVGEYIRTKSGQIAKCTGIEHRDIPIYYFDNNNYDDLQENELSQIKKHSKNILDLIEGADIISFYYSSDENAEYIIYVERVDYQGYNSKNQLGVYLGGKFIELEKLHISSILTYEQFRRNGYEL